jgi:branched-chain amino acid transport system ATP-binding protein
VLLLDNVTVGYGKAPVLHAVSLEVHTGEIVALIGANGAGKSTTLRTISGVLKPTKGKILFEGRNIAGLSPEQVAAHGIAHVPEGRRVFPGFTVRENLEIARLALGRSSKAINADIDRIMSMFPRLHERQNQYGWSLSGGEQQMLVIGRGLVANPRLLMLDEPSLGLAPTLVDQVYDVIEEIRAQGTTILLVEQNASMALSVANRAYVLELGNIVLDGSAEQLANSEMVKRSYLGLGTDELL